MRILILLLLTLLLGLTPCGYTAQTCLPCNPLNRDSVEDCCDEPCLDDASTSFINCICQSIPRFDACTAGCEPTAAHCKLTKGCVDACRSTQSAFRAAYLKQVRRNIRGPETSTPSGCGPGDSKCNIGLRASRRIANACFAEGQRIDRKFCIDQVV